MANPYYGDDGSYPPPQQGYYPPPQGGYPPQHSPNPGIGGYPPPQHPYDQNYASPAPPDYSSGYAPPVQQQYQPPASASQSYYDEHPHQTQSSHSHYDDHPSGPGAYADRGYENHAPGVGGPEGERGLGATLIGAGSGAFVGHELGGGTLGTIGGIIAGAVGANALEKHHKKYVDPRIPLFFSLWFF
ncbi:hypothetical protein MMC24_003092 [Lignoscripta atroalba]|nr:hypothetical protein [Lignoscripta atroalba]